MHELRPKSRTGARGVPGDGPRGLRRWLQESQEGALCTEVSLRLREPQLPTRTGDGSQLGDEKTLSVSWLAESDVRPNQT